MVKLTTVDFVERAKLVHSSFYNYEIISEIHGEAGFIWNLEKEEKRKLKNFNYQPRVEFRGSVTECFTK